MGFLLFFGLIGGLILLTWFNRSQDKQIREICAQTGADPNQVRHMLKHQQQQAASRIDAPIATVKMSENIYIHF